MPESRFSLFAVEVVRAYISKRKADSGTLKDATASLSVAFITGIFNNLIMLPIMFIFMGSIAMVTPLQLGDRINELFGGQLSGWAILVSFAICIPLADFLYYWPHRSAHRVEVIWGSHSVHHSSEHFNPTTATRISFLDQAWDLVLMSAICLLGFNPIYALVSYALVLLHQLPLHQMWTGRLPAWYEFFFNTPMHHRAHHAYQRMYIDKNFGGITIIWDRIFGTFVEVDDSLQPEFGLTQKVDTYNPFKIMTAEFVHMGSSTTIGFDTGAILRPWTRFPGQTSYTQGAARILVDAQGGFTWERRAGKTIYISIRSEDATVVSNRLILRTN